VHRDRHGAGRRPIGAGRVGACQVRILRGAGAAAKTWPWTGDRLTDSRRSRFSRSPPRSQPCSLWGFVTPRLRTVAPCPVHPPPGDDAPQPAL